MHVRHPPQKYRVFEMHFHEIQGKVPVVCKKEM